MMFPTGINAVSLGNSATPMVLHGMKGIPGGRVVGDGPPVVLTSGMGGRWWSRNRKGEARDPVIIVAGGRKSN